MKLSRRSILKGAPALFFGWMIPTKAPSAQVRARRLLLNRFFVAGFQFYDGPSALGHLKAGTALTLKAEPDNAYDANAVEIFHNATKLGYVPRDQNKHICHLLSQNAPLACRVTAINAGEAPWRIMEVEVGLD